ncbi:type I restriction enzyme HsdR N-terminal domain-containing protein [Gracilimonas tropica]|uniref:type I restriction enzyme HsdR N-terminal domain-containing protein n=1 Tax=Gracilimonas tropica TaxID=454600 RepID=UPI00037E4C10|nr:type I restriction enzyme HsdR N-terminal domain-containing protein [Gracilimonas tropica]
MLSKALAHYPQFRYRDEKKVLWNPILKKTFVIRPEERVRLALVDYLILEAGVSRSRISFESPVKLAGDKSSSRTDIICYDQAFKPLLLVECKAPDIRLDEKTAIQIARYNQKVEAPYLLISNGILDFWYSLKNDKIEALSEIPEPFFPEEKRNYPAEYWQERMFLGSALSPEIRPFVIDQCKLLFGNPHQPTKFLNFDGFHEEFALSHYYSIFGQSDNIKIGLSLSANPFGGTRLNGVLNDKGANTAFFTSSLNLIAENHPANTEIHSAKGIQQVNLRNEAGLDFSNNFSSVITSLKDLLLQFS